MFDVDDGETESEWDEEEKKMLAEAHQQFLEKKNTNRSLKKLSFCSMWGGTNIN
jgi:hypothetical protein